MDEWAHLTAVEGEGEVIEWTTVHHLTEGHVIQAKVL